MSILRPPPIPKVRTDTDIYTILDSGTPKDIPDSCAICLNRLFATDDSGKGMTSGTGMAPVDNQQPSVSTQNDSGMATTSGGGIAPANNHLAKLKRCGHIFHTHCIEQSKMPQAKGLGYLQCPVCKMINGVKIGTQPVGGKMNHQIKDFSLAGYEGTMTIEITYNFQYIGRQGPEHPHPGKKYGADHFPRRAYIPDTKEGWRVLKLLKEAFNRRLTFTVRRSETTLLDDMVTWNDIPHKTNLKKFSEHGYPDPDYLDRVIEKLKEHGISDEDDNNAKADDKDRKRIPRVSAVVEPLKSRSADRSPSW